MCDFRRRINSVDIAHAHVLLLHQGGQVSNVDIQDTDRVTFTVQSINRILMIQSYCGRPKINKNNAMV